MFMDGGVLFGHYVPVSGSFVRIGRVVVTNQWHELVFFFDKAVVAMALSFTLKSVMCGSCGYETEITAGVALPTRCPQCLAGMTINPACEGQHVFGTCKACQGTGFIGGEREVPSTMGGVRLN